MAIESNKIIVEQEAIDWFNNNVMKNIREQIYWYSENVPGGSHASQISNQFSDNVVSDYKETLSDSDKIIQADKLVLALRDFVANYTRIRNVLYRTYLIGRGYQSSETRVASLQPNPSWLTGNLSTSNTSCYDGGGTPPFTQDESYKNNVFTTYIKENEIVSAREFKLFCSKLLEVWETYKNNSVNITYAYCHSSCHSNCFCHGSGRSKR